MLPLICFTVPDINRVSWELVKVPAIRKAVFFRAILGYFSIVCYFKSLDYISIGNATSIRSLTAPIGAVLAYVFLGERMSKKEVFLLILAVTGLLFISLDKDDGEEFLWSINTIIGITLALLAALSAAMVVVIIRNAGKSVHYLVMSCAHALVGVSLIWPGILTSGIIRVENLSQLPGKDVFIIFCLAIVGTSAQVFRKLALENERAGIVSILCNSQVIFSFTLQWVFLSNVPSKFSLIGAGLITAATLGLSINKLK